METKVNLSATRMLLIAMAAASLFIMLSLNQINYLVHGDLYNYGLQFSYVWAMPYWVFSGIVFGLCWINIAITSLAAIYVFKKGRKTVPVNQENRVESGTQIEEKGQRKLSEFVQSKDHVLNQEPQMLEEVGTHQTRLINEELRQVTSPTEQQSDRLCQKDHE